MPSPPALDVETVPPVRADAALSGTRLLRALGVVALSLLLLGPLATWIDHVVRQDREDPGAPLLVLRLLDLNRESSIPTWFSVALLLMLAAAFAASGAVSSGRVSRGYAVLAAAAAWMSMDEAATVHELLSGAGRDLAPRGEQLGAYVWVLPGAVAAGLVGTLLLLLARALPAWQRRDLVRAGMVYLTGAVAIESATAAVTGQVDYPVLVLLGAVEEACEMGAVLLALRTALAGLQLRRTRDGLLLSGPPAA